MRLSGLRDSSSRTGGSGDEQPFPGIRCRLVPGRFERQGDTPLHSGSEIARHSRPPRQALLKEVQLDRDHVWQAGDWRRIAIRYDGCPKVFLSAIALAVTVMFLALTIKQSAA